ncbi:MAG: glutathione S-transferase family protein [Pseudomonadales bacterium]|nr:glutathione S-transferase family protein [Halioglobus sp.]MCP5128780.1 glutathione S-transferase family protein [Pseudomonadales bacterium]
MVTLHGFSYSNYYNIVKHVLLHKEIPFREDLQYGGDEAYLAISPLGKIPGLTTEDGQQLSESSVCCDYLEETYPAVALYPADSFQRARVRQVMKISELYLELPCRRLIAYVFGDSPAPEALREEVRGTVERGIGAMNRLCTFDPYVLGSEITMADIYLRYVLMVVENCGSTKLDWDIVAEINGLREWQAMMGDTAIARRVDADMRANHPEFLALLKERFGM